MPAPVVAVRIHLSGAWPEERARITLERKYGSRRTYELLHVVECQGHIQDDAAVAFLEELQAVAHDILGRCGYGAQYLDLWGEDPY